MRELKEWNPKHEYLRRLVGCGHGVAFNEKCEDCEIINLCDQYLRAEKAMVKIRAKLEEMGFDSSGISDLLAARGAGR